MFVIIYNDLFFSWIPIFSYASYVLYWKWLLCRISQLWPLWGHCGVIVGSLWGHCGDCVVKILRFFLFGSLALGLFVEIIVVDSKHYVFIGIHCICVYFLYVVSLALDCRAFIFWYLD